MPKFAKALISIRSNAILGRDLSHDDLVDARIMDNRFSRLFNLTEAQAIEILDSPEKDSETSSNRYIAASHLVNFDSEAAIASLVRAVQNDDPDLDNRIVRRKALESLGRLQVKAALPLLDSCLEDEDNYLVENAAWAMGEIGTDDEALLEKLTQQLARPEQSYRTIIQALATLGYRPAVDKIKLFTTSDQAPIASAALTAVYRLTGDERAIAPVLKFLQNTNVNARRGSIQDLMDANYYQAIPQIASCPVSCVFRLRGIKQLAKSAIDAQKLTFAQVQSPLENVIRDHPKDIALIHSYDRDPTVSDLVKALYGTDFGQCYLAAKTLLDRHAEAAPTELISSYKEEGYNDYGAHYHIMRMFGWLKVSESYDLLIEALNNKAPQFQKSRMAAAIALGELADPQAISPLISALSVPIWDLQYAALMALSKLGETNLGQHVDVEKTDWLVQEKLNTL